ncbi:MAG TPA: hypothetical protein VIC82_00755, partial [Candidatus Nanopelagicales bacterium]
MTAITPSDLARTSLTSRRPSKWMMLVGIFVVWIVLYLILDGRGVFGDGQPTTAVQDWFKR